MTITLRSYQADLKADIHQAWNQGATNVIAQLATGGGKTAIVGSMHEEHPDASCVMAHRQELVGQLSLCLARYSVRHDLIAAEPTKRAIARAHLEEYGRNFFTPGARCKVASVDTLIRADVDPSWAAQVTLVTPDEGHHVVVDNKWDRAINIFGHRDRRVMLPTATPERADGKGLGRAPRGDGIADVIVRGPTHRWLIDEGFLTDYDVVCPTSDIEMIGDPSASGDWSPAKLKDAARRSHITGDVPTNYLKFASGLLGISFCTDVETAIATCQVYRSLGVSCEVLTGETHDSVRRDIIRRYKAGHVKQLCVVDIVSEGFDLPNMQVGSFGRPSESRPLVRQQMGRLFRPMYAESVSLSLSTREGRLAAIAAGPKPRALLIDHVGHFIKPHIGPPDRELNLSLDRRDKKARAADGAIPFRICIECIKPYERFYRACPFCGHEPQPQGRSTPAAVEGDLELMDPAVLAALRGDVIDISDGADARERERLLLRGVPYLGPGVQRYQRDVKTQVGLRASMAAWGGVQRAAGRTDAEMQRKFWHLFGLSVLEAQALHATDADNLRLRVDASVNDGY